MECLPLIITQSRFMASIAPSWYQLLSYSSTLWANGLYPSYHLSGLCISLYLTAHTCTNSTEQYIRLALQPVLITNYLVLIPSSLQL